MTVEEANMKLAHFASKDKNRPSIGNVKMRGRYAYVTDGRIALRATIDSEEKNEGDNFPYKAIDEFMECVDSVEDKDWMAMDLDQFMKVGEKFMDALRAYEVEQRSNIRERYKHASCPCCGADVYWDDEMDTLVEFEDVESVDSHPGNVEFPVGLNLQDGMSLIVGFGYLYLIRKALGEDVLFSKEIVKGGYVSRLLFKTKDGSVKGVLMPLRTLDDGFEPDHKIDTRSICEGDSEKEKDGTAD